MIDKRQVFNKEAHFLVSLQIEIDTFGSMTIQDLVTLKTVKLQIETSLTDKFLLIKAMQFKAEETFEIADLYLLGYYYPMLFPNDNKNHIVALFSRKEQ